MQVSGARASVRGPQPIGSFLFSTQKVWAEVSAGERARNETQKHPSARWGRQKQTCIQLGKLPCRGAPVPLRSEPWCRCCCCTFIGIFLHSREAPAGLRPKVWLGYQHLQMAEVSRELRNEKQKLFRGASKDFQTHTEAWDRLSPPLQLPPGAFAIQQPS